FSQLSVQLLLCHPDNYQDTSCSLLTLMHCWFCFFLFHWMAFCCYMFFYLAFDHLVCVPDLGQVVHIRQSVYLFDHIEKTIIIFCSCLHNFTFIIMDITKYNCFGRASLHTCSLCFTICQSSVCFLCIKFCFL